MYLFYDQKTNLDQCLGQICRLWLGLFEKNCHAKKKLTIFLNTFLTQKPDFDKLCSLQYFLIFRYVSLYNKYHFLSYRVGRKFCFRQLICISKIAIFQKVSEVYPKSFNRSIFRYWKIKFENSAWFFEEMQILLFCNIFEKQAIISTIFFLDIVDLTFSYFYLESDEHDFLG